ncbi:MAG: DUF1592 domain-containing protein [Planctomycetaceae bacterium]|nr:DUF1592 domain-containing protein [Planctomycetaceae bacterium]
MYRLSAILMALVVCSASTVRGEEQPDFSGAGRGFLEKHCLKCHQGEKPAAELSLEGFRTSDSLIPQRGVWDRIRRMIATGTMPPEDQPRPTVAEITSFTRLVNSIFDYSDRHSKPDPGRVTMRRLNRVEYRNTIRDLLGADFDPSESFPTDDVGHGFDNIGDVLTVSPLLMERYLDAAETIVNRVIVVDPPKPSRRYLSGRFLQPNNANTSQGRFRPLDPESAEPFESGPYTAPASYLKFSADADLIFRARLYAETDSTEPVKVALFLTGKELEYSSDEEVSQLMGANLERLKPLQILKIYEITARTAAEVQEIEFPIHRMGTINNAGIAVVRPAEGVKPAKLHIESLWSEGPLETRPESQLKLLACTAGRPVAEQTREVLSRFLKRAYRRPHNAEELERLAGLTDAAVAGGEKWEAGIQRAIAATLCSPKFLFRVELDDRPQSPEARELDEFQLASRLSYFLWSTMPDDELLELAGKKQLTASLDVQVRRMLEDPKSIQLVRNFALQWLQIQRLLQFSPDAEHFPTFTEPLRQAMLQETELFFESIMREDRSVIDLLAADYTFLNEPLARHYGIADTMGNPAGGKPAVPGGKPVRGDAFQRVTLQDGLRGGLLTQASVLTVTSNPTRTSPVKRGRWVLEQILGEPPPPPPPDVPELAEGEQAASGGTLRQRMEIHRRNPNCASCHARMDPIGNSLENFDATGAWRSKDGEFPIDAVGEFPDGTKFDGPGELKAVLKGQQDQFVRCLTEKMMTYALGRGLEYYDRPGIEKILKSMRADDYRFSVLVTEIVKSDPFRKRRGTAEQKPAAEKE